MRRHLVIIACLLAFGAIGQSSFDQLDDKVSLRVNSNGLLSIDLSTLSPQSSWETTSNHFLSQAGIWMSATDQNSQIYTAVQLLTDSGEYDTWEGPLDTFTAKPAEGNWDYVWKVSRAQIETHKEQFSSNSYTVPDALADWPAYSGIDLIAFLAPFADANGNGSYDPENGDYPVIKGDEAIYVIFNDNKGEHPVSNGMPLEVEVHLMVYKYNELPSTIFLEYYVMNRSQVNYTDLRFGLFLGGQCGNDSDNYARTLVQENAVLLYNADPFDEGYFGGELPYVFGKHLGRGMSNSLFFSMKSDSLNGLPTTDEEFDHFLHGKWRNGQELTQGGNGTGNGNATSFMYEDPVWTEEFEENPAGQRNAISVVTITNLPSGSHFKADAVLGFGLYSADDQVFDVVDSHLQSLKSVVGIEQNASFSAKIYPNPVKRFGELYVTSPFIGAHEIQIVDIQGVEVLNRKIDMTSGPACNIALVPGVYIVHLKKDQKSFTSRLVVEP